MVNVNLIKKENIILNQFRTSKEKHERVMKEIQEEWENNNDLHQGQKNKNIAGMRSSQISALVMYLIKQGTLKHYLP